MLPKHLIPLISKPLFIAHLIRLNADTNVGTVRNALEVRDYCKRLINNAMTKTSDRKTQIRVLVVSRRKVLVETTQTLPKFTRNIKAAAEP